jgi:A/G-specific adenine glycosylase
MRVDMSLDVPFNAGIAGAADRDVMAAMLLGHYDRTARTLPWRAPPGSNAAAPYRVWLSEIMLQQTTVAAVIPYFEKFTRVWPTVHDLAAAPEADVMAAWAGLGYYARARNLIACARAVVADHGGRFPETEVALRNLPGVGAYTAAAVAAIAFGERAVVVDANVERVTARLFAIEEPLPGARPAIRAAADIITPSARCGDFAQAMMDLGAGICTPRSPKCGECPLKAHCRAFASGDPARLPVKAPKAVRPEMKGSAWWIEKDKAVWLIRRPPQGLLGGMRALPGSDWTAHGSDVLPFTGAWTAVPGVVRHVFTHFALELTTHRVTVTIDPPAALGAEGSWWPLDRIGEAGLPGLFDRVAKTVLGQTKTRKRRNG